MANETHNGLEIVDDRHAPRHHGDGHVVDRYKRTIVVSVAQIETEEFIKGRPCKQVLAVNYRFSFDVDEAIKVIASMQAAVDAILAAGG